MKARPESDCCCWWWWCWNIVMDVASVRWWVSAPVVWCVSSLSEDVVLIGLDGNLSRFCFKGVKKCDVIGFEQPLRTQEPLRLAKTRSCTTTAENKKNTTRRDERRRAATSDLEFVATRGETVLPIKTTAQTAVADKRSDSDDSVDGTTTTTTTKTTTTLHESHTHHWLYVSHGENHEWDSGKPVVGTRSADTRRSRLARTIATSAAPERHHHQQQQQ